MRSALRPNPTLSALALSLALLAGCAGTVKPTAPVAQAEQQALPITGWWLGLNDALLNARIELALRRNADLAVAAARLREARAQLQEAGAARLPQLSLELAAGRSRGADVPPMPGTQTRLNAGLVAGYELDLWGRLDAGDAAARARLASEAWACAAMAWSVSTQVAELHTSLGALQRQVEIGAAVVDGRRRTLALRERELRAGAGSEFELRRAEAELAVAESTLATLKRQQLARSGALALLLGDAAADLRTPALPASLAVAALPSGELSELLARRPDVQQAEALLTASAADIKAARAGLLPSVRLSGRLGSDAHELSQWFSGPGLAWSLAGSLVQSIFDGGRNAARVEQAEARGDAQQARHAQVLRQAAVEASEALAALAVQQQSLEAGQRRSQAMARALQLAQRGREAGALSQLDALDAERQHFQAQLDESRRCAPGGSASWPCSRRWPPEVPHEPGPDASRRPAAWLRHLWRAARPAGLLLPRLPRQP